MSTVGPMTKLAEIQSAILLLDPTEREELRHWLDETAEETPGMIAAIDEGRLPGGQSADCKVRCER